MRALTASILFARLVLLVSAENMGDGLVKVLGESTTSKFGPFGTVLVRKLVRQRAGGRNDHFLEDGLHGY